MDADHTPKHGRLCPYCTTRPVPDGYVTCGSSDCQEAHCAEHHKACRRATRPRRRRA